MYTGIYDEASMSLDSECLVKVRHLGAGGGIWTASSEPYPKRK